MYHDPGVGDVLKDVGRGDGIHKDEYQPAEEREQQDDREPPARGAPPAQNVCSVEEGEKEQEGHGEVTTGGWSWSRATSGGCR